MQKNISKFNYKRSTPSLNSLHFQAFFNQFQNFLPDFSIPFQKRNKSMDTNELHNWQFIESSTSKIKCFNSLEFIMKFENKSKEFILAEQLLLFTLFQKLFKIYQFLEQCA